MKLIFITREGYGLSGARVRCYNFARALKSYGKNAQVFSFADNLGAKYGEEEREMGLSQKVKYNFQAYRRLKELSSDSLIFMQRLNYHSLVPFLVTAIKRSKFIFDCDDWNIREDPKYILGVYPTSKAEFLTRKLAKRSCFCLAASRFLERYLSHFNDRVYYLPTGVDTERFTPLEIGCQRQPSSDASPKDPDNSGPTGHAGVLSLTGFNSSLYDGNETNSRFVFSWIGTVYTEEMQDNLKFIVECFLALNAKYPKITLEILGQGQYFEKLRKDNGVSNVQKLIFKKWIHPDKMPAYLSKVDVGLLPLIQNTKFNRAKSPTKLFEYMGMEKPVVASFLGEAKEIISDGKTGFLARNKEEFVRKMESLIINQELRKKMGLEARKEVLKNYSLNVLGKRLYNILQNK